MTATCKTCGGPLPCTPQHKIDNTGDLDTLWKRAHPEPECEHLSQTCRDDGEWRCDACGVDPLTDDNTSSPQRVAGDEPNTRQPTGPGAFVPTSAPTDHAFANREAPPERDNGASYSTLLADEGMAVVTRGER